MFYNLSDPAMEDLLYEAESVRRLTGLEMGKLPDESTILNFRQQRRASGVGDELLEIINEDPADGGLSLKQETMLDASTIIVPPSRKNHGRERDPEMKQCQKGRQWHFGMKLHIGVDDESGMVQCMATTAANVHDLTPTEELLHGEEKRVWGDAGYQGIEGTSKNPLFPHEKACRPMHALSEAGFLIVGRCEVREVALLFEVPYMSRSQQFVPLRPELKLEFTVQDSLLPPVNVDVKSLLREVLKQNEIPIPLQALACQQTLVEKVVAFLRRTADWLDSNCPKAKRNPEDTYNLKDERLVCHLYDVQQLLQSLRNDDLKAKGDRQSLCKEPLN